MNKQSREKDHSVVTVFSWWFCDGKKCNQTPHETMVCFSVFGFAVDCGERSTEKSSNFTSFVQRGNDSIVCRFFFLFIGEFSRCCSAFVCLMWFSPSRSRCARTLNKAFSNDNTIIYDHFVVIMQRVAVILAAAHSPIGCRSAFPHCLFSRCVSVILCGFFYFDWQNFVMFS